jgi:beta-carotene hydroxylase
MLLRNPADRRTMVWAFGLFPAAAAAHYEWPWLSGWLLPLGLYIGFCSGVFSHNHNHCPTFATRPWNVFYAAWVSFFYGYPTFAWIPTHNQNHHKYINRPGDATITWRYSKKHNWTIASTYFFVSAYWQSEPLKEFIRKARATNRPLFRQIVTQYSVVGGGHALMFALAVWLHGWGLGTIVYLCAFGIPAGFALWSMIFINYIQHVHCDPWSKFNHSRNFVSRSANWLVFNNGFHTAHHAQAGLHWSKLAEAHALIAHEIDPELKQPSILWFSAKNYILGIFFPSLRTRQIGRAAYDVPGELDLSTASVEATDAGVNASIA